MAVKLKKSTALATLSITPLIDVVFILLIFTILTMDFANEQQGRERYDKTPSSLDVNLPTASEAQPLTATPSEIFITITPDGKYYLQKGGLSTLDQLDRYLEKQALANPINPPQVTIQPDNKATMQYFINVADKCNKYKIPWTVQVEEASQ